VKPAPVPARNHFERVNGRPEDRPEGFPGHRDRTLTAPPAARARYRFAGRSLAAQAQRHAWRGHDRPARDQGARTHEARGEDRGARSMTITPQMIEAAARAIRDHVAGRSTFTGFRKPRPWNPLPPTLRDDYREEAARALTAGLAVQDEKNLR
jgi:hypothetical protein